MSRTVANFDPVAHIYRWAEYLALGPFLQRTRTHFLSQLDDRRNALILGDGDGRFLAALLRQNQHINATAIDISAAMLIVLRKRCAFASKRLKTEQASLLEITPSQGIDTITTHFVLDCLSQAEINQFALHIAANTQPGTLWLLSDFGSPASSLIRPFAALYVRLLYLAFAVLTGLRTRRLPDPQSALRQAGFACIARHDRLNGFLYTELWQNNAITKPHIHLSMSEHPPFDAQSDPEPAAPSLPEPDPGVYHHETGTQPDSPKEPKNA